MKRPALLAAMLLVSAWAQAAGLPFAVESFQSAKEASSKDASRHTLVFYTSEN